MAAVIFCFELAQSVIRWVDLLVGHIIDWILPFFLINQAIITVRRNVRLRIGFRNGRWYFHLSLWPPQGS